MIDDGWRAIWFLSPGLRLQQADRFEQDLIQTCNTSPTYVANLEQEARSCLGSGKR